MYMQSLINEINSNYKCIQNKNHHWMSRCSPMGKILRFLEIDFDSLKVYHIFSYYLDSQLHLE